MRVMDVLFDSMSAAHNAAPTALVNEKKIPMKGTISRRVATVPKLKSTRSQPGIRKGVYLTSPVRVGHTQCRGQHAPGANPTSAVNSIPSTGSTDHEQTFRASAPAR